VYLHQDVNVNRVIHTIFLSNLFKTFFQNFIRNICLQIIFHENYGFLKLKNDIAIAILDKDVDLGLHIGPICLPPAGLILDDVRCFASGWGKKDYGNWCRHLNSIAKGLYYDIYLFAEQVGLYQAILKRVELPVIPRDKCQKSLQDFKLGKRFRLHDSFVCAGGEAGKDTCKVCRI